MEVEKFLDEKDFLVSTTDRSGKIVYANFGFSEMAEYSVDELYGQPHNIVRHPGVPKVIFKYVWQRLLEKKPLVAYVKNYTSGKDKFYWVKAFMYPVVENGAISLISSYRTKPSRFAVEQIDRLYKDLLDYERSRGVDEALVYLENYLSERDLDYDGMIKRLNAEQDVLNLNKSINK